MPILKTKTWADNEGVNYDDMNANFDTLYAKLNGNIENEDVSATGAIAESKLAFNTSSGHNHDGTNSKLIAKNRGFSFAILGTLTTGNDQGVHYIVPQAMTVVKIWGKCTASNIQCRVQKNTTDIKSGFEVGSTVTSSTSFTSTSLEAGDVLSFDITGINSGATDVFITLECTQP